MRAGELAAVLEIERAGVELSVGDGVVALGAPRAAAALAVPSHRRAVACEAIAVTESAAAKHRLSR